MASLSVSNANPRVGEGISITGAGFDPSDVILIKVDQFGFQSEVTADAAGFFGTDDVADHAVATLTSSGVNVSADDEVVLGAVTYVFKASVTTTANQVKIGADAEESLANLKAAINLESNTPAKYGSATVVHPTVGCRAATATTLALYAKTGGTGGNSLASTTTAATLSFGGATFAGGSAATGISSVLWTPVQEGTILISAEDESGNSASTSVRVWTSS